MIVIAAISGGDADEQTLIEATGLANAFDDELHVVHVQSYDSLPDDNEAVVDKTIKEQTIAIASSAAAGLEVSTVSVGLIGQPATEILQYAEEVDTRFIVIGGQKRSPVGKALFGSTTQQILLGSEQPVVTVMGPNKTSS